MFLRFGNVEFRPEEIVARIWAWKQGTTDGVDGLTVFGDLEEINTVTLYFKSGGAMTIEGPDAQAIYDDWIDPAIEGEDVA